jgi:hypothetical protein
MENQQPPERVGPNQMASGTTPIEKSREITVSMSSVWGCPRKCLLVGLGWLGSWSLQMIF